MTKRLNLIDSYGYVFRAYYALPPLTNPEGVPVGAVYGFCRMMLKLLEKRKDELFLSVFDTGEDNYRHALYQDYKANRLEAPEDLKVQFPLVREACHALGLCQIEEKGYEADDVIASYAKIAKEKGYQVSIISADKDFMQLVDDEHVTMFHPIKETQIGSKEVYEKFGVKPEQVIDIQSLMGDSSDNIPGVRGVGPKGASQLISEFGSLENLYTHIHELKPSKRKDNLIEDEKKAFLSKELVTLQQNTPLRLEISGLHLKDSTIGDFCKKHGFKSLSNKISSTPSSLTKKSVNFEEFKTICLESFEFYFYIPEDFSKEDISCFANGALFTYTKDLHSFIKDFQDVLENTDIIKLTYNIKNFIQFFPLENYHAIESLSLCLYLGKHDHSLESLCLTYGINFERSAETIYKLSKALWQDLKISQTIELYFRSERFLAEILMVIEKNGIYVDTQYLEKLAQETTEQIQKLEEKIYRETQVEFNINSPKQLGQILFEKFQMPIITKTKTGSYSTDSDVLQKLVNSGFNFPTLILEHRLYTKLLTTYIAPLLQKQINSRIHTTLLHKNTLTGRLASQNPNLQNIPFRTKEGRELRKVFSTPSSSIKIVSFDYSQIELRLLAHYTKEQKLIEAFNNKVDIHSATAQEIFGVQEVTDSQRRQAKIVNFGILYGMGVHGLSESLKITRTEAQKIIDRYFDHYPKINEYIHTQIQNAKTKGYVTTVFNRRIHINDINSPNKNRQQFAERQSLNAPLQGSNADIIKVAMYRIHNWLKSEKLSTKMVLQIHDELLFEIPENELDLALKNIKLMMETVIELDIPIIVDCGFGKNWYEAHK